MYSEVFMSRCLLVLTVCLTGMSSRSNLHRYQGYLAPIHTPAQTTSPPTPRSTATWGETAGSLPLETGSKIDHSDLITRSKYPGFYFKHEHQGFDELHGQSFGHSGGSGPPSTELPTQALSQGRSRVSRGGFEKGVRIQEKVESMKPRFDLRVESNPTVVPGQTAQLQCRVFNLGNKTVSWFRQDTMHILSFGNYTFTSNKRFKARYSAVEKLWLMEIRDVRSEDAGVYECQVSSLPVISNIIQLSVVGMLKSKSEAGFLNDGIYYVDQEPSIEILGDKVLYVEAGSTLNVTCVVTHPAEEGENIRWIHKDKVLNYNTVRKEVSVFTRKGSPSTSRLIIYNLAKSDTGRYSCVVGEREPASISVHVEAKVMAELYSDESGSLLIPLISLFITASILLLLASIRMFIDLRKRALDLPK